MKAGILAPDVAQPALDAIQQKRKRRAAERRSKEIGGIDGFDLGVQRYQSTLKELAMHVASERAVEHRELIKEMLGGGGTVFDCDGRIGARFSTAGLLALAESSTKSRSYNSGSGGAHCH